MESQLSILFRNWESVFKYLQQEGHVLFFLTNNTCNGSLLIILTDCHKEQNVKESLNRKAQRKS